MFSRSLTESTQFSCMWWGGEIIAKCPRIIMKVFASIVFLIGRNFYSHFSHDFAKEKGSRYTDKILTTRR